MFGWVVDKSEIGKRGDSAKLSDSDLDQVIFEHLVQRGNSEEAARRLLEADRAPREPLGGSFRRL